MSRIKIDSYGHLNDEHKARRELIARVNAEAEANWDNPEWRREMAAELFMTIYRGFDTENLLDLMIDVERVGKGDRVFIKEVRGLRVFFISRGGQIDQSTLRENVVEIPRDMLGFHVSELDDKIEANFAVEQGNVVNLAIRQMDATLNMWLLRLFQTAIPDATSDYYVTGNGLPLATLKAMIREVQDETESGEVTVIGRTSMTGQVFDAIETSGIFAPETNEQLLAQGFVGRYHGARIRQLVNYKNDLDRATFPANELFVFGRDAGKFGFFGGMKGEEWSEQGGFYWHSQALREVGALLAHPERVRRFVDTSIPAGT